MARTRKRQPLSFQVPDGVLSESPSGWVFRSDTAAVPDDEEKNAPAAERRDERPPARPRLAKSARTRQTSGGKPAGEARTTARPHSATASTASGRPDRTSRGSDPWRVLWLPFAMACTTVLAWLPGTRPPDRRDWPGVPDQRRRTLR